jgi:hypothetical protein
METRRTFLTGLVLTGVSAGLAGNAMRAGASAQQLPPKPTPGQEGEPEGPPMPNPEKRVLEENDKDIKKKVEHLYQLAAELKDEVEKTDSSKVLSLNLMKKAEAIEKLARDIKNRSKG